MADPSIHNAMVHLASGALARSSAAIITCPLDVIKTRMQIQGHGIPKYHSISHAFQSIIQKEGPKGLYRGLGPRLMYITPAAAVSFTVYESIKSVCLSESPTTTGINSLAIPAAMVAGGCARVLGTLVRTPFDVVKLRLQVQHHLATDVTYRNMFDAWFKIWRKKGFKGLFVGFPITLSRDAPFAAIYFSTYEYMKYLQKSDGPLKTPNHLLAGACAGVVACSCTIPLDVVKTRLQTQDMTMHMKYTGIRQAFIRIWHEEGILGLTGGLRARLASIIPAASLTFAFYEYYKQKLS